MMARRKRDNELMQKISKDLDPQVRSDPELVASSIHEAGHAVANKLLFGEVLATQIVSSGIFESAIWGRPHGNTVDALRKNLIVLLAGSAAKRKFCPGCDDGGVCDRDQARYCAATFMGFSVVKRKSTLNYPEQNAQLKS